MKNLPSLVIPAPACAGVNSCWDLFGDGDDAAVKPIHPLMAAQAAIHVFYLVDPGLRRDEGNYSRQPQGPKNRQAILTLPASGMTGTLGAVAETFGLD